MNDLFKFSLGNNFVFTVVLSQIVILGQEYPIKITNPALSVLNFSDYTRVDVFKLISCCTLLVLLVLDEKVCHGNNLKLTYN